MENIEKCLDQFFAELQHTPGEWKQNKEVVHNDDIFIASIYTLNQKESEYSTANSKLITQSPSMLRSICRTYLFLLVKFPFNDRQNSTVREIRITLDGTLSSLRNEISNATGLECQHIQDTFEEYALQINDGIDVKQHRAWVKQGRPGE